MSLRRKTRASLSGPGSSNASTPVTFRKRFKNSDPTRKWVKVLRCPAPTVPFKVLKWVPVDELSDEERKEWNDEQQKIKGSIPFGTTKDDEIKTSENDAYMEGSGIEKKTLMDADVEERVRIVVPHTGNDEDHGII